MKSYRTTIGLSFVALMALASVSACKKEETKGGGPEPNSGATPDPLTGDWSGDICFGAAQKPDDVESCKTTLSFNKDLTFSVQAEWVNRAATATFPGCTTTKRLSGQKWSTDHETDTLTITGESHATMERAKCVNEKDNLQATAATDITVRAGEYQYSIDDGKLNIESGPLRGTYNH